MGVAPNSSGGEVVASPRLPMRDRSRCLTTIRPTRSGAIDHGVHIEADVLDDGHGRIEQVDLDTAELVDAAARAVLVAQTHDDALDAVAVARQPEP